MGLFNGLLIAALVDPLAGALNGMFIGMVYAVLGKLGPEIHLGCHNECCVMVCSKQDDMNSRQAQISTCVRGILYAQSPGRNDLAQRTKLA